MPAAQQSNFWQRARTGSKAGFDKLYGIVDKLGPPVNKLSNKLGSEAFWPTTLDKESDKAARILKSFCKDGFYQEETKHGEDGPTATQKVLKTIPKKVIQNAKGLAIFTTMRTGLWVSGAGGSGILVARLPDGRWSPPSGIMLHTAGLGFLVGIDIYDCVIVINTEKALQAFSKVRCTLGGEVSAVAGPLGVGGVLESEIHKRQAPIFTYLKSRGFYAGVQIDGTIVIERTDENERFYSERISVGDILAGKARHPPLETRTLTETLKAAQGDTVDESLLPTEKSPADIETEDTGSVPFGIPDPEDDDPYGVRALSQAGLDIKEAGTKQTADSSQFEFNPAPTSPVWRSSISIRRSMDARSIMSPRSSWRTSSMSINTEGRPSMVEMSTQTDFDELPASPRLPHSPLRSPISALSNGHPMEDIPEHKSIDDVSNEHKGVNDDVRKHKSIEDGVSRRESIENTINEHNGTEVAVGNNEDADADDEADDGDDVDDAVIHEVQRAETLQPVQVPTAQVITRARLVEVPKRGPPPQLPPRNPIRNRGKPLIIGSEDSPNSPSFPRRQSGGSTPESGLTRSESASSLDSVELSSALTNGFGQRNEKESWPLSSKVDEEASTDTQSPTQKSYFERESTPDKTLLKDKQTAWELASPPPAVPGSFAFA